MNTKILYIILIGVAASSLVAGAVYGLGNVASPGTNLPGANTLYAIKVNPGVTGTIAHIVVNFQGGYTLGGARIFNVQNIGAGHLSFPNSTTLSYDVTSPVSVPSGTQISIILGNINNPSSASSNTVKFVTEDSTPTVLESGQITLNVANSVSPDITDTGGKIGINNPNPQQALDVGGNIQLSGNLSSSASSGSTLKIVPPANGDICIGSC